MLYNMETEEFFTVKAGAVILASGGIGRLHIQRFPTTNHYGAQPRQENIVEAAWQTSQGDSL